MPDYGCCVQVGWEMISVFFSATLLFYIVRAPFVEYALPLIGDVITCRCGGRKLIDKPQLCAVRSVARAHHASGRNWRLRRACYGSIS